MLYYCLGGGYGHLTRFLAFCHTFSLNPELITASADLIEKFPLPTEVKVHVPDEQAIADQESFSIWLEKLIVDRKPPLFFIDAFPGGILGELCNIKILEQVECVYLARLLKWQEYLRRISGTFPKFSKILRLEELSPEHEIFLKDCACPVKDVQLIDPPMEKISDLPAGFWLVIHSNSGDELEQLWNYALDTARLQKASPFFVVVAPGSRPAYLPNDALHLDTYPATSLLKDAAKVISAAGFNICRQMQPYREKHLLMPFKRSLDDQFLRAERLTVVSKTMTASTSRQV